VITLNGWKVPGYETKISCGVKLDGEDLSGAGSYLINADKGIKGAVVSVTTKIPFVDKSALTLLITKSKTLDENGARQVFTINSDITEAYKVRKAVFDGEIKTIEDEDVHAWVVSFKLLERQSKSEREQQQRDATAANNSTSQVNNGHVSVQQAFDKVEGP